MSGDPVGTWVVLGLIWLALYVAVCAWFPYRKCRAPRCERGRKYSPFSGRDTKDRPFRPCGRCGGSGLRVRLGRRVYEVLSAAREEDD